MSEPMRPHRRDEHDRRRGQPVVHFSVLGSLRSRLRLTNVDRVHDRLAAGDLEGGVLGELLGVVRRGPAAKHHRLAGKFYIYIPHSTVGPRADSAFDFTGQLHGHHRSVFPNEQVIYGAKSNSLVQGPPRFGLAHMLGIICPHN